MTAVERRAYALAREHGLVAVGPEVFLLAILEDGGSRAAQALCEAGMTYEALLSLLIRMNHDTRLPENYEPNNNPQLNPAAYGFLGVAEGIALGQDETEVTHEHFLVAYLWYRAPTGLLEALSVSRESVVEELRARGVRLPGAPLPTADRHACGEPEFLAYDELIVVLRRLPSMLPEGARHSFNFSHKTKRGWVAASDGVDLRGLIEEIRRDR